MSSTKLHTHTCQQIMYSRQKCSIPFLISIIYLWSKAVCFCGKLSLQKHKVFLQKIHHALSRSAVCKSKCLTKQYEAAFLLGKLFSSRYLGVALQTFWAYNSYLGVSSPLKGLLVREPNYLFQTPRVVQFAQHVFPGCKTEQWKWGSGVKVTTSIPITRCSMPPNGTLLQFGPMNILGGRWPVNIIGLGLPIIVLQNYSSMIQRFPTANSYQSKFIMIGM